MEGDGILQTTGRTMSACQLPLLGLRSASHKLETNPVQLKGAGGSVFEIYSGIHGESNKLGAGSQAMTITPHNWGKNGIKIRVRTDIRTLLMSF
jgi:hypothetical protein